MQEDWRLLKGQEDYLKGKQLRFCLYLPQAELNDHDHCEFCMEKLEPNRSQYAYCTLDRRIWICQQCFKDFCKQFSWELEIE